MQAQLQHHYYMNAHWRQQTFQPLQNSIISVLYYSQKPQEWRVFINKFSQNRNPELGPDTNHSLLHNCCKHLPLLLCNLMASIFKYCLTVFHFQKLSLSSSPKEFRDTRKWILMADLKRKARTWSFQTHLLIMSIFLLLGKGTDEYS